MCCQFFFSGNAELNRRLVLVLLFGMVHGGLAFAEDTAVLDILDSTAFNVAMFALGWAATRRMKSTEASCVLHWLKAFKTTPAEPKLCDHPALLSDGVDVAKKAVSLESLSEDAGRLEEAVLFSPDEEDSSSLLAGLTSLLASRASHVADTESPPWRRSCFHSRGCADMHVGEYLDHIHWFFECSSPCLVLALVYLDRALSRNAKLEFTSETCHGLVLSSLVMALKFHDEDYEAYPNKFYAEIGKVCAEDFNIMEKQFCKLLDWNFYVGVEEYSRYRSDILAAARTAVAA